MFSFELIHTCKQSGARAGIMHTSRGDIPTPVFMPVGTQATVKGIFPHDLKKIGAKIILANTYHLWMRPGPEIMKMAGGVHKFMNWDGPMLTDSGGFQVFSLSDARRITEEGVHFKSHVDGSAQFLSPEKAMELQNIFGADIIMQLDECNPYPADRDYIKHSSDRTARWLERCIDAQVAPENQALFGIIQGGMYADLRRRSAEQITSYDLPGYAVGGLSVGEPLDLMNEMLEVLQPMMPEDKPRYMMGVGSPDYLLESMLRGIDMFDCVLPTRIGRNGAIFTSIGRLTIRNAKYAEDFSKPDEDCDCMVCRNFTKAYIRHLIKAGEMLGMILASYHNLYFLIKLCEGAREAILEDRYLDYRREFYEKFDPDLR